MEIPKVYSTFWRRITFLEDLAFGINFAFEEHYCDPKDDKPDETESIPTERTK